MNRREMIACCALTLGALSAVPTVPAAPVLRYSDVLKSYPLDYYPQSQRELNTVGRCVHSSVENILKASGAYETAATWEKLYTGGEYSHRLAERFDAQRIGFAMTTTGSEDFLRWATGNDNSSHRMCAVSLLGAHVLNLCALTQNTAFYLNNWQSNYQRETAQAMDRDDFLSDWRKRGGWAFAILSIRGKPLAPPIPRPVISPDSPYTIA